MGRWAPSLQQEGAPGSTTRSSCHAGRPSCHRGTRPGHGHRWFLLQTAGPSPAAPELNASHHMQLLPCGTPEAQGSTY